MGFAPDYTMCMVLEPTGVVRAVLTATGIDRWDPSALVGHHVGRGAAGGVRGEVRHAVWQERIDALRDEMGPVHYLDLRPDQADGEPTVDCMLTPVRRPDGAIESIVLHVHDLTRSLQADRRVRASEQHFRALAEALPQMVWVSAPNDAVTYFSPRWCEFTGRTMEDLLGRGYIDLIHPDDVAALLRQRASEQEPVVVSTFRLMRHDGEYRWMESYAQAVFDEAGVQIESIGGTTDITDRRLADELARSQDEQLRTALALNGLGSYIFDIRERRIEADERFSEIIGADPQVVLEEQGLEGFVEQAHVDDRAQMQAALFAAVEGGADYEACYRLWAETPTGPQLRWIEARGRVELDDDGPVRMVGVIEDVTRRKREDEARLGMQKREAIGTLAGGVAHDFNNLIGAILSNAAVAEYELKAGASPATSISEIARGARRAGDLVQRLLTFSREEQPRRVSFDLGAVVGEVCQLLRPTLPPDVTLTHSVARDLPLARGDSTQLHQVVMNLITNAGQAIGKRPGTVELLLDHVVLSTDELSAEAPLTAGDCLRLRVIDDGPGIPSDIAPRIFDPFFTTKAAGDGTGLGLSAVQTIVGNHGGTVVAASSPDEGTVFTIHLPIEPADFARAGEGLDATPTSAGPPALASRSARAEPTAGIDPTAATPTEPHPDAAPPPGSEPHALFVDDESALVRLAERALPLNGCRASGFTDPDDALAAFTSAPDAFDALITDFSMPSMTGLELVDAIRAVRPDLPIVLTTGFLTDRERQQAEASGVDRIIAKPCPVGDLAAAVTELVADRARREN
jgi:PAS domain S-box-containing protein